MTKKDSYNDTHNEGMQASHETAIKQALDTQLDSLDDDVVARLRQARAQAVAEFAESRGAFAGSRAAFSGSCEARAKRFERGRRFFWMAGSGAVAACALALIIVLPRESAQPLEIDQGLVDSLVEIDGADMADGNKLVTDDSGVEFFAELDFYIWLEREGLDVNEV